MVKNEIIMLHFMALVVLPIYHIQANWDKFEELIKTADSLDSRKTLKSGLHW